MLSVLSSKFILINVFYSLYPSRGNKPRLVTWARQYKAGIDGTLYRLIFLVFVDILVTITISVGVFLTTVFSIMSCFIVLTLHHIL